MALVSGPNHLDERKPAVLCDVVRKQVKRANADIVREATGFAIGGVPPSGRATRLPIFINQDFWRFGLDWVAAGTPNAVFAIIPTTLRRLKNGVMADLTVELSIAYEVSKIFKERLVNGL